jgi:hypothetical protein
LYSWERKHYYYYYYYYYYIYGPISRILKYEQINLIFRTVTCEISERLACRPTPWKASSISVYRLLGHLAPTAWFIVSRVCLFELSRCYNSLMDWGRREGLQSTQHICDFFSIFKPSGHCTTRFNIQQFYVLPTLYLCVLCGSQNKQPLFPYAAKNWLVFITELECVCSAVRTGYLNKAVCACL